MQVSGDFSILLTYWYADSTLRILVQLVANHASLIRDDPPANYSLPWLHTEYQARLKHRFSIQRKDTNLIRKSGPWYSTTPAHDRPASIMSGRRKP